MKRGGISQKTNQNTRTMNNEQNTQIAPPPPCFIHSVGGSYCGSIGQKISVKGEDFFIGDVVLLTHRKTNRSKHYQIFWNDSAYRVDLVCENNRLANVHPFGSEWHDEPYIPLFKIVEGFVPYVDIKRIGQSKSDLKLVKRIPRKGMKPAK